MTYKVRIEGTKPKRDSQGSGTFIHAIDIYLEAPHILAAADFVKDTASTLGFFDGDIKSIREAEQQ